MDAQNSFMFLALQQAEQAKNQGEVPVGAVLVHGRTQKVIAMSGNRVEELQDPTAHAEMLVIREGARLQGSPRLAGCHLYVTLEPCPMCATAISLARLSRLYFGAYDHKGGGVENGPRIFSQKTCHFAPEYYGGISEEKSAALLREFFQAKRRPS